MRNSADLDYEDDPIFGRENPLLRKIKAYLLALLAAFAISIAWLNPQSRDGMWLGWGAALSLVALARSRTSITLPAYAAGLVTYTIGFYWLHGTIEYFGGFDTYAASGIFAFFVAVSAVQFVIFSLWIKYLPKFLDVICLKTSIAWVLAEIFTIKIFPWHLGHTQLPFTTLIQVTDIAGAALVSFLMIWISEALYRAIILLEPNRALSVPMIIFSIALAYGAYRISQYQDSSLNVQSQKVALIQGNIPLSSKHQERNFRLNTEQYISLSEPHLDRSTLIVWPETIVMDWIPTGILSVVQHDALRSIPPKSAMIIGALTFDSSERAYNSALAIQTSGAISDPYHKRILMPFGEYTPGTGESFIEKQLPTSFRNWLKETNSMVGNFSSGTSAKVFEFYIQDPDSEIKYSLKASPLICYEDVVTQPARESVLLGANLLVNLTNDSWFGRSVAAKQHNQIASFRSIENRRYLIRATESGLTSIINALGQTTNYSEQFKANALVGEVKLLTNLTPYTKFNGEQIWLWLLYCSLFSVIITRAFKL